MRSSALRNFLSTFHLHSRPNTSAVSQTTNHNMVVQGVGSMSSPIVISDDEDEALIDIQLRVDSESADGDQSNPLCVPPNDDSEELSTDTKGYHMALNMGYCPGRGLGRGLDGRVEPVCLEVGTKRKRTDSGIGFQRSQRCTPGGPLRKGDGKLNMKRKKEQRPLGAPFRVSRSQRNFASQAASLTVPTGPAKANQRARATLASNNKGKERERATVQQALQRPVSSPIWRPPMPPQGPRSTLVCSPPLAATTPPKGPRSWLASQGQGQSPLLAPQTPPTAPRTPPTAPRAMQKPQNSLANNGYIGPSTVASSVPQPGYHQTQTQPTNVYADGKSVTGFSHIQQPPPPPPSMIYNAPFAGGPVMYQTAPESYEPWQTQYGMAAATAPPLPPTCFIAYPDYSNPGAYTYVPVPAMPSGYAPAPITIDPHAAATVASASMGLTSPNIIPPAAPAFMPVTGLNQHDGDQPMSVNAPNDDDDNHSDFSMPESSSSKRLLTERTRKPKFIAPIGHAPETDPNSKMGTYVKPLPSQPNPACTLVLDGIPTRFRNPSWVHKWALNAGEAEPICLDVDSKSGKALVEFVDASSARVAFQSKQLKGKGKHAIRAWWYRVTGVGSNAGVGEIEEGEVEDGSTKQSESIVRLSKGQKKKLQWKQQGSQGGSSGTQVAASADATVDQKAHAPSAERVEVFAADAATPHGDRFSFDGSVRFDVSSGVQDGVEAGRFIPCDNGDDLSIASSRLSSDPPVVSHDGQDKGVVSTPLVTPGDSLSSSSEVCGDKMTDVDPPPSCVDVDMDSISADDAPVPALDSGVPRSPQPEVNLVEIPATALLPPPTKPVDDPEFYLQSSLLCTETSDEKSVERSSPTKVSSLVCKEELEDSMNSNKFALTTTEVDVVDAFESIPTLPSSLSRPASLSLEPSRDKIALEMNLRRLVRESKHNKANGRSTTASPAPIEPIPLIAASPAVNGDIPIVQHNPASSPETLEDLAVSFISETIEGVKPTVVRTTTPMNARHELLQKQLKLEQYISQSKDLIARLSRAQSKEEKEDIMCAMREWSRLTEMDSVERKVASRFCWPSSCEETLLVVSDDEDED